MTIVNQFIHDLPITYIIWPYCVRQPHSDHVLCFIVTGPVLNMDYIPINLKCDFILETLGCHVCSYVVTVMMLYRKMNHFSRTDTGPPLAT